jgi:hypothetical protein
MGTCLSALQKKTEEFTAVEEVEVINDETNKSTTDAGNDDGGEMKQKAMSFAAKKLGKYAADADDGSKLGMAAAKAKGMLDKAAADDASAEADNDADAASSSSSAAAAKAKALVTDAVSNLKMPAFTPGQLPGAPMIRDPDKDDDWKEEKSDDDDSPRVFLVSNQRHKAVKRAMKKAATDVA